jgi:hypothetical protein
LFFFLATSFSYLVSATLMIDDYGSGGMGGWMVSS